MSAFKPLLAAALAIAAIVPASADAQRWGAGWHHWQGRGWYRGGPGWWGRPGPHYGWYRWNGGWYAQCGWRWGPYGARVWRCF